MITCPYCGGDMVVAVRDAVSTLYECVDCDYEMFDRWGELGEEE